MDPEYDVLWTFSPSSGSVSCFNPTAADIEGESGLAVNNGNNPLWYMVIGHLTLWPKTWPSKVIVEVAQWGDVHNAN